MEPLRDHPAPSPSGSARNSGSFLFPGPKLNSIPLKRRLRHGKRAGPPGMRVYPNPMDHLPQTAGKATRKLSGKTGKSQFSISFQDSLPQQSGIAMELLTWIRGNREAGAASTGDFWGENSWIWCPGTAFQQDTSSFPAGSLKECASTFLCRRDATKRSLGWAGEGWK